MARDFNGSTDYLETDSTPFSGTPFTMVGRVNPDQDSSSAVLIQISDKDVSDHRFGLYINSSGRVVFRAQAGGGNQFAVASGTVTVGNWTHMAAVSASATDRRVYRDGANKDTNTVNIVPAGLDRISIGRAGDSSPSDEFDGRMTHAGLWNVALTDSEILSLANGADILSIRRGSLINFWPVGGQSPEQDVVGNLNLTISGTPTQVAEAPFPRQVRAPG